MKISLITPSYNSAKTIARTVESVIAQNYPDLEYIVIDGTSSDSTAEIVKNYQSQINIRFVSEKDRGIYDAMNKGLKLVSGELVGILNSDDLFDNDQVLRTVADSFSDQTIGAVYGDVKYFSDDVNKVVRYWRAGKYRPAKLNNGWTIPHPALFVRQTVYNQVGFFNEDFKIAGDYEFILRLLKIHRTKVKYIPLALTRMYNGGISGSNLKQRKKGWEELKKAWVVNNFKVPLFFIYRRILSKIFQYLTYKQND
jgi:glycosyltransferase involved in cell wall biosynthesis